MKEKFEALDGLRGLAALSVVLLHRRAWFGGDTFFGHSHLAVDFFFMLSVFVIAHAYGGRAGEKGSFLPFVKDRVIRLHPMILLGSALGLIVLLGAIHSGTMERPPHAVFTYLFGFIPLPATWAAHPFLVDPPTWSIFWELIANFLFALVAARLTNRLIAVIIILSAIPLLYACLMVPGLFAVGAENENLWYGLPRVLFSFFIGVALLRFYREGRLPWLRMKWSGVLLLIASFTWLPPKSSAAAWFDPLVISLLYPAIILSTARWQPTVTWPAQLSGALSYPLYILHEPVLKLISAMLIVTQIYTAGDPGPIQGAARIFATILIAWVCLKLYDEPVRRWLRSRFGSRPDTPIAHDTRKLLS